MRLVKKEFEKDGSGWLKLVPTEAEDMWHAYNLIAEGDTLTTTTTRKVKSESSTGSVDTKKVHAMTSPPPHSSSHSSSHPSTHSSSPPIFPLLISHFPLLQLLLPLLLPLLSHPLFSLLMQLRIAVQNRDESQALL